MYSVLLRITAQTGLIESLVSWVGLEWLPAGQIVYRLPAGCSEEMKAAPLEQKKTQYMSNKLAYLTHKADLQKQTGGKNRQRAHPTLTYCASKVTSACTTYTILHTSMC